MNSNIKKISVIGLGYIGLPTAAMFALKSIQVVGIDIDANTVNTINAGKIHIVEPDLEEVVHDLVSKGYLRASLQPEPADAFLITVPTPFKENYQPDLSYVTAAVNSIAAVIKKGDLIILESTSPIGTTEAIAKQLAALRPDLIFPSVTTEQADVNIAYCPERVMPGQIIRELIENDRIIGGITKECAQKAKALYQLFVKGVCLTTNSRTAEMTKLTENAFRDVNIAFANELSMVCDQLQIDCWELIQLANHHPRVKILQPGPGVGGHCIAVDPWFIVHASPEQAKLIRKAREVNDAKSDFVLAKIYSFAAAKTKPIIACMGLSYKANTNDLRESPAVKIVQHLLKQTEYHLLAVEPNIDRLPATLIHERLKLNELEQAIKVADIIVLLVNHKEFQSLNEQQLQGKIIMNFVNEKQFSNKFIHQTQAEEMCLV